MVYFRSYEELLQAIKNLKKDAVMPVLMWLYGGGGENKIPSRYYNYYIVNG
jgi:hypothetical protein